MTDRLNRATPCETTTFVPMPQNAPKCPIEKAPAPPRDGQAPAFMPRSALTTRQAKAIELLLLATPLRTVLQTLRIDRKTLYRWRHHNPAFARELSRRQSIAWQSAADRVRALLDPAVDVLADQLKDVYDPTRFRAAVTLLRLADIRRVVAVHSDEVTR